MTDTGPPPLDAEELQSFGEKILALPEQDHEWVMSLYQECVRARMAEAEHLAAGLEAETQVREMAQDVAQVVLDAAEWLRTLWEVGYMGSGHLPASPRSSFPQVEVEDVLKSALLARIRCGKRPLPFPPPTRDGVPWHEIVDAASEERVDAQPIVDEGSVIAFAIAGDSGWDVVEALDVDRFRLQHRGKGPLYLLVRDESGFALSRQAPTTERVILSRSRAGMRAFALVWPADDGRIREVSLRAATPERAEVEAGYWIARQHPDRYGQIRFRHETVD
jgi:hypothetical protein